MRWRRTIFFTIVVLLLVSLFIFMLLNNEAGGAGGTGRRSGDSGADYHGRNADNTSREEKYKPIPSSFWSYYVAPIFENSEVRYVDLSERLHPNMSGITYRYHSVKEIYLASRSYLAEHGIDIDKYNLTILAKPMIARINNTYYVFDHIVFIHTTNYGTEPYATVRIAVDALQGRIVFYSLPISEAVFNKANASAENAINQALSLLDIDPRVLGYSFKYVTRYTTTTPLGPVLYKFTSYEYSIEVGGSKIFLWSDLLPSINIPIYIVFTRVNDKYFIAYREQYILQINITMHINNSCKRNYSINKYVGYIFNILNIYNYTLFNYNIKSSDKVYVMAFVNNESNITYSLIPVYLYAVDIVYGKGTTVFTGTIKLVYSMIDCKLLSYEVKSPIVYS